MKTAAIILLGSYLIYLGEIIKIPLSCLNNCGEKVSCSGVMKHGCRKKHDDKKPGCDSNTATCANCPFNSVTITEAGKYPLDADRVCRKIYPQIESFILQLYTCDKWKPPNNVA